MSWTTRKRNRETRERNRKKNEKKQEDEENNRKTREKSERQRKKQEDEGKKQDDEENKQSDEEGKQDVRGKNMETEAYHERGLEEEKNIDSCRSDTSTQSQVHTPTPTATTTDLLVLGNASFSNSPQFCTKPELTFSSLATLFARSVSFSRYAPLTSFAQNRNPSRSAATTSATTRSRASRR